MTPGEAIQAGLCGICCGTGLTFKILEGEESACSMCRGGGTIEAMWAGIDKMHGVTEHSLEAWVQTGEMVPDSVTGGFMIEMDPEIEEMCALCGKVATGYAAVWEDDGFKRRLCHTDDVSCYVRWTVYGDRP